MIGSRLRPDFREDSTMADGGTTHVVRRAAALTCGIVVSASGVAALQTATPQAAPTTTISVDFTSPTVPSPAANS
jgi:hypothetical protein